MREGSFEASGLLITSNYRDQGEIGFPERVCRPSSYQLGFLCKPTSSKGASSSMTKLPKATSRAWYGGGSVAMLATA
ncbi:hypothetical protein SCAR479_05871 [Seiridium cardinale]|uniref:Uncharacterized protein n=1 Tax=Seiridium cardinale TaxID=138064 RepID=A0ABR2XUI8_9PEZI